MCCVILFYRITNDGHDLLCQLLQVKYEFAFAKAKKASEVKRFLIVVYFLLDQISMFIIMKDAFTDVPLRIN